MPTGGSRPSDKGGRVGGGHLDPEIRGARSQKKFFSALRASVWSKNKGARGRPPRASPLDPSLMPLYFSPIPYVSFGTQIAKETKSQATVIATVYFLKRQQRTIRYRSS